MMTDSLYKGTGGHNYIQEEDMETSFIKQQIEESMRLLRESGQYVSDTTRYSDVMLDGWFDIEELTAQIIKNTFTEALRIIDEHDPNKSMARKTSSAYWGNTLRKEIEDIINNITNV